MPAPEEGPRTILRWVLGIIAIVVVNFFVWALQGGVCTDYVNAPGVCTSGPTVGWPGAIVISLASVLAIAYFAVRIRRGDRR